MIDIHVVYQDFDARPNIKLDQNTASGASSPEDEKQVLVILEGVRKSFKENICYCFIKLSSSSLLFLLLILNHIFVFNN